MNECMNEFTSERELVHTVSSPKTTKWPAVEAAQVPTRDTCVAVNLCVTFSSRSQAARALSVVRSYLVEYTHRKKQILTQLTHELTLTPHTLTFTLTLALSLSHIHTPLHSNWQCDAVLRQRYHPRQQRMQLRRRLYERVRR